MIKVNLLNNVGGMAAGGVSAASSSGLELGTRGKIGLFLRAFIVLIPPLVLMVYEHYTTALLETQLSAAKAANEKLKVERSKFGDTAPRVRKFTKDKERIDHQVEVVKSIAHNRLREVKAFDALQTLMPSEAWLKKVEINSNKLLMVGFVKTDEGVTELIKAMENSTYFSHVEPRSTTSEKVNEVLAKKFEIEMVIGKDEDQP